MGAEKVIRKIRDASVEMCVWKTFVQSERQRAISRVVSTGRGHKTMRALDRGGRREQHRGRYHRTGQVPPPPTSGPLFPKCNTHG